MALYKITVEVTYPGILGFPTTKRETVIEEHESAEAVMNEFRRLKLTIESDADDDEIKANLVDLERIE